MKTGIIILCRYNSSRLRGKILKKINGEAILSVIVNQLRSRNSNEQIIVATSKDKSDQKIVDHCIKHKIDYFTGDLNNVSERFFDCANKFKLDYAVRINGDNVFIDTESLTNMLEIIYSDNYDIVTNVPGRTFPYGMSIEIINVKFYSEVVRFFSNEDQEHVTSWFYKNIEKVKSYIYQNDKFLNLKGLKLAVDTAEDLKRCRQMHAKIDFNNAVTLKTINEAFIAISSK